MSIQKYEERVREDKLNWHDKAAELDSFQILRQPSDTILGRGNADVKFNYKNDKKSLIIYGPEDAVFDRALTIIKRKKNPLSAGRMKYAFIDAWKKAIYHKYASFNKQWNKEKKLTHLKTKIAKDTKVENIKTFKGMNEFLIDEFYSDRKRNPLEPKTLLENEIKKRFDDVNSFADKLEKNKSSVYHHTSGKRDISIKVASEYATKLKCDPVDLMFPKKSIPVWAKVNLLKAVELEQPYEPGRIYTYYTEDKNMEQVIVPRDLYQEDIKAIKISALGSMYDNLVAFYYRATARDESCLNKLCVVGIKGDPDNPFDNDDQWYFGLYENIRGKANLINPDPFISNMENKYILKDCRPDIMAPVVAIINPEAIVDKTKMRFQIPHAALIREEERLLAEKATIKLAQEVGKHQRKVTEQVNDLNQQIANIQEKIKEQVSDRPDAMNWLHQERETMQRFRDKISNFKVVKK